MTDPSSIVPTATSSPESASEHIARIVEEQGRARVSDLAARFGVSAVTIRKDLVGLEAGHRLVRTHGGAIAVDQTRPELVVRHPRAAPAGREGSASAQPARRSSTTARASSWTPARRPSRSRVTSRHATTGARLTVITNGLRIASELAGHPGITVLMLGGRVRWEALSVVGQLGDGLFQPRQRPDGVRRRGRVHASSPAWPTRPRRRPRSSEPMVAAAREVIAIVDHTKWEPSGVRDVLSDRTRSASC